MLACAQVAGAITRVLLTAQSMSGGRAKEGLLRPQRPRGISARAAGYTGETPSDKRDDRPSTSIQEEDETEAPAQKVVPTVTADNAWGLQKLFVRKADGTPLSKDEACDLEDQYNQYASASLKKGDRFARVTSWTQELHAVEVVAPTTRDLAVIQLGLAARGLLCQEEKEFRESGGQALTTLAGLIRSQANFSKEFLELCVQDTKRACGISGVLELTRLHRIEAGLRVEVGLNDEALKDFTTAGSTIWMGSAGYVKFLGRQGINQNAAREVRLLTLRRKQQLAARFDQTQQGLKNGMAVEDNLSA